MYSKLLKVAVIITGVCLGPGFVMLLYRLFQIIAGIDPYSKILTWVNLCIFVVSAAATGITTYIFSDRIAGLIKRASDELEERITRFTPEKYFSAISGLLLGLIIAYLIMLPVSSLQIAWFYMPLSFIVYILCVYIMIRTMLKITPKITRLRRRWAILGAENPAEEQALFAVKILDTSAIIDGRIEDVYRTGIIEGNIAVPSFVLAELQRIADSADAMRRSKGRRGLDILASMQKDFPGRVEILHKDYEELQETGQKLVRLASERNSVLITSDYNLNKIALVQGVRAINLNDLANALKPVLLAGESFVVRVIREGREEGQGIAYMSDGTMIVIENGKDLIGQNAEVEVTSVLTTSAGRMIFARIK